MSAAPQPAYMAEPWFALLKQATQGRERREVAQLLGVSPPVVTQILNATGHYGSGRAGTGRVAARVLQVFGTFECPHLTAQYEEPRVITGEQCAAYARTRPPVGSPGAMEHWRACQKCPRRSLAESLNPVIPNPGQKEAA